jgi:hypothetical protein
LAFDRFASARKAYDTVPVTLPAGIGSGAGHAQSGAPVHMTVRPWQL